ncbi:MAG: cytidylate kinase family protein [bacterium]|nr:cytidylate kinase family protein [bacterium]
MIITLSGLPGSGKSTVGRMVAEHLGYQFYSMGDLRGKMAMDRGITIDELNEIGKSEDWTDREVDEYQKKLGETEDNFVIDGWVSFHFIPQSFKVFLDIDPTVGATRIFEHQRPDEAQNVSVQETQKRLAKRVSDTDARYQKYYGVSFLDRSQFDLVIDTSDKTPEEVAGLILAAAPSFDHIK